MVNREELERRSKELEGKELEIKLATQKALRRKKVRIECLFDEELINVFDLREKKILIGRSPELDLPEDNIVAFFKNRILFVNNKFTETISREHARFIREENRNGYKIMDLGSENGTFVNGRKLKKDKKLSLLTGDTIKLGLSKIEFKIYSKEK